MKTIFLSFFLVFGVTLYAQYSNPYRMTFDGSNYFITNKGNGTVSRLDSTFTHSTAISGLHSPNDIFFGSIAGNSAIMVLDSNIIKLFSPTTYASLLNIPVTGAVEAHDGIYNPNNSNEFFISDRAGNKIIKGVIGSAPFYPITFSTLITNISKPAGMIFNNQGKLLVVSDTLNSKVYEINISSGTKTTVLSTSLDNFNDIAQDNEGNYYITCWGNNNLYRYNNSFASPYVVATFNNPSGLFSNLTYDYLGIACYNCQKVEFKYYHLFSPLDDVTTCVSDSFFADFTPTYAGIGTYFGNNKFEVEMSDSNGNFSSPITVGSVSDSIRPSYVKAAIPKSNYASSGYKYRMKSTSPEHFSYFEKELTILPQPNSNIHDSDTAYTCIGTPLPLSIPHDTNYEYSWFPPVGMQYQSPGSFLFQLVSNDTTYDYWFQVKDTSTGCISTDKFSIRIKSSAEINLHDSLDMCLGDSVEVGGANLPYIYTWQGSSFLDSYSSSNPTYYGTTSAQLVVAFSDSLQTCYGTDSVYVNVSTLGIKDQLNNSFTKCFGDTISIGINNTNYTYNWTGTSNLDDVNSGNPRFYGNTTTQLHVTYSDTKGICTDIDTVIVNVIKLPGFNFWIDALNVCKGDTLQIGITSKPNFVYSWDTSFLLSDTAISNPLFYAIKEGNHTLVLTIRDSNNLCSETNSMDINVIPDAPRPTLTYNSGWLSLNKDYRGTYKWKYFNSTTNKDTIVSTDTNALNIDSLHYSTNITVEITDSNGCVLESFPYQLTVGLNELFIALNISPNPSNGNFIITTKVPIKKISLIDLTGKTLKSEIINDALKARFQNSSLLPGTYMLEVITDWGAIRKKVIVH